MFRLDALSQNTKVVGVVNLAAENLVEVNLVEVNLVEVNLEEILQLHMTIT